MTGIRQPLPDGTRRGRRQVRADDIARAPDGNLMGGRSFHAAVRRRLTRDGQLSDTIYSLEVARPCVGCFIKMAAYYGATQWTITQPVG